MKKNITILNVVLFLVFFVSQSLATVVVSCENLGGYRIGLNYDFTGESSPVRAFNLDIQLSDGIILSASDFSLDYWVYPGSIDIDPGSGDVTGGGSPIADPGNFPVDTLGGIGTNGMTIEMGSLYSDPEDAPSPTGLLLTFVVSQECDIAVTENFIRSGVILEDPDIDADFYSPPFHAIPEPSSIVLFGLGVLGVIKRRCF